MRECNWTQQEVAADLGVTVRTIQRLEREAEQQKIDKDVAPVRKAGSGRRRTFGKKQIEAIENLMDVEPGLTCHQVKLRLPKILAGVGRRTIQRIIQEKLDMPSIVRPTVPFLTEEGRKKRVAWAKTNKRRTIGDWRGVLFADECPFHTKQSTGGRRVRKPRNADRFDPKYTRPTLKKPQVIIFWGGISASGRRVHGWFQYKEKINSESYMTMLKKNAFKILRQENLTLCHDLATPHTSKPTSDYLAAEGIKTMFTPGKSPDANPIENLFAIMKKRLEAVPTRTIEEVKKEATRVWRGLPDAYLEELCTSMRRRCSRIINNNGFPTKY